MNISEINDTFKVLQEQILGALQECSDRIECLENEFQKERNKKVQIAHILLGDNYDH